MPLLGQRGLRLAMADAVELHTESVDGFCSDCEVHETGRCFEHQATLQQRADYMALAGAIEVQAEADMELGL